MISVTVAAQGKKQRLVGGHLKAYGSGRLSILDLSAETTETAKPKKREINIWNRAFTKVLDVIYTVFVACFPFVFTFLNSPSDEPYDEGSMALIRKRGKRSTSIVRYSAISKLDEKALGLVFAHLHPCDVIRCEMVCKKWRRAVETAIHGLSKIQKDQIRFLFDEGEVVVYPVDEKRCPRRYPMPSLQVLARKLKHLNCLSLFVRGLIPVESSPVLKALAELSLAPTQIYLIWCKLSPASGTYLADFLHGNVHSLTDLGLEECAPGALVNDALLAPVLPSLVSLRVWNDGKSGGFGISDDSLLGLADAIRAGSFLETVDIACATVSCTGVVALIEAWTVACSADLSLSLSQCPLASLESLLTMLDARSIYFRNGKILRRGHCLSLFL